MHDTDGKIFAQIDIPKCNRLSVDYLLQLDTGILKVFSSLGGHFVCPVVCSSPAVDEHVDGLDKHQQSEDEQSNVHL